MTTKSDAVADEKTLVLPLSSCTADAAHLIGGKALGLGQGMAAVFEAA